MVFCRVHTVLLLFLAICAVCCVEKIWAKNWACGEKWQVSGLQNLPGGGICNLHLILVIADLPGGNLSLPIHWQVRNWNDLHKFESRSENNIQSLDMIFTGNHSLVLFFFFVLCLVSRNYSVERQETVSNLCCAWEITKVGHELPIMF